jgi:hypothetical protein
VLLESKQCLAELKPLSSAGKSRKFSIGKNSEHVSLDNCSFCRRSGDMFGKVPECIESRTHQLITLNLLMIFIKISACAIRTVNLAIINSGLEMKFHMAAVQLTKEDQLVKKTNKLLCRFCEFEPRVNSSL